ncbi:hypothetical protein MTR_7g009700 [Medicago truncatula]|uniref:Uncharacterized protein n=1 Tax=Medicago truncatula TaxID=3880 RepID=G7KZU6_MEDTR|nr:hypothetical protein MTR_7g009700 [Medicago truncatula]
MWDFYHRDKGRKKKLVNKFLEKRIQIILTAIGQAQTCDLFRRPDSGLSKSGLA